VLPFTNMSGDHEQEYFSDGITDDLITDLSRGPDIFIIARTSTFTYKGKLVKVQEVGRELGVKYVLEGSVRRAGDKVRIDAQLVDATTGAELWAERYDRPMRDIFALQDDIVRKIVTTLNLQLTLWKEHGILTRRRSDNLDAYDDYLRGWEYSWNFTKEGNAKAQQMFEKAIALDPQYAEAYSSLGFIYWFAWVNQWTQDSHALDRAVQLSQHAIALDDSLPGAHIVLSYTYASDRQYDQAITEAERAIALGPNSGQGYCSMASALNSSGKPAEALGAVHKAMRLDPRNQEFYSLFEGAAYMLIGRYEEAIPPLKSYLARYYSFITGHLYLIVCYVELGRNEEARAEAAEVMRINPQFSLAVQKQRNPIKEPLRDRLFGDVAKAGLK
jgi:adenylate cyclase